MHAAGRISGLLSEHNLVLRLKKQMHGRKCHNFASRRSLEETSAYVRVGWGLDKMIEEDVGIDKTARTVREVECHSSGLFWEKLWLQCNLTSEIWIQSNSLSTSRLQTGRSPIGNNFDAQFNSFRQGDRLVRGGRGQSGKDHLSP